MPSTPDQSLQTKQSDNAQFEKIERFQALSAGMYWRALDKVDRFAIPEGCVLLLKSIRWVDGKAHTMVLEPHPLKVGKAETHVYLAEDGTEKSVWVKNDEHRFLLEDFLALFEYEPDAAAIRATELGRVQAEISDLQKDLADINVNPEVLEKVVSDALAEESVGAETLALDLDLPSSNDSPGMALTVGDAVSRGITRQSIDAMAGVINKEKRVAEIKSQWIQKKTEQISATVKKMVPFFSEQAKAALAATEDVQAKAGALLEGVQSLELYIGTNVHVERIATGKSAPRSEKLTFIQRKLAADEEVCLWADVDESFDVQSDAILVNALASEPGFVSQIFPTQRCVLVMATTRRNLDYGSAAANEAMNARNKSVFLLIRDGENISRVYSPVESHLKSARLFPDKDEQGRCFAGVEGSDITFEDVRYTDGLRRHEQFALHYKRFLLLVAGLDHREKLFGDFYEGEHGLDFMTLPFQEAHFHFIHDEDGEGLIEGDRRADLMEWLDEKNAFLRSGSRVLCNWYSLMNPDTAPSACKEAPGHRGFTFTARPDFKFGVVIAEKVGDQLACKVQVSKPFADGPRCTFLSKVTISEYRSGGWGNGELPYLCLDTVSLEEVRWYLGKRNVRSENHLTYVRFFKHALRFLQDEAEQQKATRQYLKSALEAGGIASGRPADQLVDAAVTAWRAANRGADLPAIDSDKAGRGWKSLLDQMHMLASDRNGRVDEVEAFARAAGLTPMRLVLSGAAKLVLYAQPRPEERDDRLVPHAWVHRITLNLRKRGLQEASRAWALLPVSKAAETILHEWGDLGHWANPDIRMFKSLEEKQSVLSLPDLLQVNGAGLARCAGAELFEEAKANWLKAREAARDGSGYVKEPLLVLPITVIGNLAKATVTYVALKCGNPQTLLRQMAPTDGEVESLKSEFVALYQDKAYATEQFNLQPYWELVYLTHSSALTERNGFVAGKEVGYARLDHYPSNNTLVGEWYKSWVQGVRGKNHLVFSDDLTSGSGAISRLLNEIAYGPQSEGDQVQYNLHRLQAAGVVVCQGEPERSFDLFELVPTAGDAVISGSTLKRFDCHSGTYSSTMTTFIGAQWAMEFLQVLASEIGRDLVEIGTEGLGSFKPSSHLGARRFLIQ